MTTSLSWNAYHDCLELFEQALEDPQGIRFSIGSYGEARQYQVRLHTFRRLDRERSQLLYKSGDPQYGLSEFDEITVRIDYHRDQWWIKLVRQTISRLQVEKLSEVEAEPEVPAQPKVARRA